MQPRSPLLCLLALCVLATACKREPEVLGEDFLAEPKAPPTPPAAAEFKRTGAILPRDGEVKGWRLKEGPAYYDSSTLYEVINGASPGYLAYGFVELAKADYRPEGLSFGEEIVVEAYQMKSPLAAFGKWSEERSSCDPPGADPGPGCSRGSDRVLHKGPYFVKIVTYDDTPIAVEQLRRMAEGIAKRIPGEATQPPGAARLPTEGMTANSLIYKAGDLLGVNQLGEGFQADYILAGDEFSLYVKSEASEAAAAAVLAKLRRAAASPGFAKEGAKPEEAAPEQGKGFAIETDYGWFSVVQRGAELAGGAELDSRNSALARAAKMLTKSQVVPN